MLIEDQQHCEMSAQKLSLHKNQVNRAYVLFYSALFIFVTELCLGIYIYTYMDRKVDTIQENCVFKRDLDDYFLKKLETYIEGNEFVESLRRIGDTSQITRVKREPVSKDI